MCGIIGILGPDSVAGELVYGLTTLQHRGQDAAGIVTFDRKFHVRKGAGLVPQVFGKPGYFRLTGNAGLGHVRYSTQGTTTEADAQPFTTSSPFGLAVVHNGNVTNFEDLRRYLSREHFHLIESTNDIELILHVLAVELRRKNLRELSVADIFSAVEAVQARIEGAYAVLGLIAGHGLVAFMDRRAIRPLVLGRREGAHAFASESRCFDALGYEAIHTLKAGEAVFVDMDCNVHSNQTSAAKPAFCVFEYIYFAREDSVFHERSVARERRLLGKRLAAQMRQQGLRPDVVIDVPSSSFFFAQGLADALGVPYTRGLVRSQMAPRSFISPTQELRERIVHQKLNPIRSVIEGRRVAVVDDSIVRGTTSRRIVELVRRAGAEAVYFASGSPPIKHTCVYGIDMSQAKEMIAASHTIDEICRFIGADALIYLSLGELREHYDALGLCDACFSGEYPTPVSEHILSSIEREKLAACR